MTGRQTNYNTLGPLPENVVSEEPVQPIREPDEYPGVQGTLGSIMMFLMRQSYIAALIIMMVSTNSPYLIQSLFKNSLTL